MTDPIYARAATRLREELQAETVVVISVGRSGLIHTGQAGAGGEALAAALLDRALDVTAPAKERKT